MPEPKEHFLDLLFSLKAWLYEHHRDFLTDININPPDQFIDATILTKDLAIQPKIIYDFIEQTKESCSPSVIPLLQDVLTKEFAQDPTIDSPMQNQEIIDALKMPAEAPIDHVEAGDMTEDEVVLQNPSPEKRTNAGASRIILPYFGYRCIVLDMIKSSKLWLACFTTLSWNLMVHTTNTSRIKFESLSWRGDALAIEDEKDKSAVRHIYANPHHPEVCPILTLGIYLMTFGPYKSNLFPGSGPSNRFSHAYREILKKSHVRQVLEALGVHASNIGVSSCRSGATAFVSSVPEEWSPSVAAVSVRSGAVLNVPGVELKMMRYSAEGDQHVGRVVAGLPTEEEAYFALPPHFDLQRLQADGIDLKRVLHTCFPSLVGRVPQLEQVLVHCLASVVHHAKWLKSELNQSHLILSTGAFSSQLVDKLEPYLVTGTASSIVSASGVPKYLAEAIKLDKAMGPTEAARGVFAATVAEKVAAKLGEQPPTAAVLAPLIREALTGTLQTQLPEASADAPPPKPLAASAPAKVEEATEDLKAFHYDGKFYSVPNNYVLPKKCNTLTGWQLWWEGSKEYHVPPFRTLGRGMLPKNLQKPFAEWRYLYKRMESELESKGALIPNPNSVQISQMYEDCKDLMVKICSTAKRKQECSLTVMTVAKRLRLMIKKEKTPPAPPAVTEPADMTIETEIQLALEKPNDDTADETQEQKKTKL